jgi:hypothetical protein
MASVVPPRARKKVAFFRAKSGPSPTPKEFSREDLIQDEGGAFNLTQIHSRVRD